MTEQVVDPIEALDKAVNSPDQNTKAEAIKIVNQKIDNDKEGHLNTQTQWAPFIFSLLARDYKGALTAWNGGMTREVDAYGPDNTRYKQQYNARGLTGRVFTPNGIELTPEQIKKLDDEGGLISKEDITAGAGGQFLSTRQNITEAAAAARAPALEAYQKAQKIGLSSAGIANLYDQQLQIAKYAKWMDAIGNLTNDQRTKLFTIVSQQNQATKGISSEKGTTSSTSAGTQTGKSQTTGANVGADVGFKAVVPPSGEGKTGIAPGVSGGVTGGEASFANTQGSSSASQREQSGATAGTSELQQRNFQSAVNGILQNAITTQQEFLDLQRYVSLQDQIRKAKETRGVENLAPGASPVPDIDPSMSGRQNASLASVQGIKNEALLSAWNHFLSNKVHSSKGKPIDLTQATDEFMATNVVRGINTRYDNAMELIRTGKKPVIQKGDVYVDNQNKPKIWLGDKWEYLNER